MDKLRMKQYLLSTAAGCLLPLLFEGFDLISSAVISVGMGVSLGLIRLADRLMEKDIKISVDNTSIIVYNKTKF